MFPFRCLVSFLLSQLLSFRCDDLLLVFQVSVGDPVARWGCYDVVSDRDVSVVSSFPPFYLQLHVVLRSCCLSDERISGIHS